MVLEPGDVITTGTPPGVGLGLKPPRYPEGRRRRHARHRWARRAAPGGGRLRRLDREGRGGRARRTDGPLRASGLIFRPSSASWAHDADPRPPLPAFATAKPASAEHAIRHDWTLAEIRRRSTTCRCSDLVFRAQQVHRAASRADEVQVCDAAVGQDRRLPGGLRLLPAVGALRRPASTRERADGRRRGARRGGARRGERAPRASAWARPGASAEGRPTFDRVLEMVRGVRGARHGSLLHARHAHRRPGRSGSTRPG